AFVLVYLTLSEDNRVKHRQFLEMLGFQILAENHQTVNTHVLSRFQFDCLVRHSGYPGEAFYLANVLDNDLSKIKSVRRYDEDRYNEDGRRVLLLTTDNDFHKPIHESYFRAQ